MSTSHLRKLAWFPTLGLMMLAAGLVVICQLLAMVMVVGQPLEKTSASAVQQLALADCIRRSTWATQHGCIRQSQLESDDQDLAVDNPVNNAPARIENIFMANGGVTSNKADKLRVAASQ